MHARLLLAVGICGLLAACPTTLYALPVLFPEQVYENLEQLEEALEAGEISSPDYDLFVEFFLGVPSRDVLPEAELSVTESDSVREIGSPRPAHRVTYHGSLAQKLDERSSPVRYDRVEIQSPSFGFHVGLEQRGNEEILIRSRALSYRYHGGEMTVGSYNLSIGKGVTQGSSNYPGDLRHRDDFGSSFLLPVKNRNNGLLIRQKTSKSEQVLFVSRVEGDEFYEVVYGSAAAVTASRQTFGFAAVGQKLGRFDSSAIKTQYAVPFFDLSSRGFCFSGESSLGLGSASAHLYELEIRTPKARQQATFFSYAREYHNLHSGGYAYSDYEETRIGEIGFSHSDKRSGRRGICLNTELKSKKDLGLVATFVRWQNRTDDRQCAAARLTLNADKLRGKAISVQLRTIWENFDLLQNTDSRGVVSLTARMQPLGQLELDGFGKIEKRVRAGSVRYPLRTRLGLIWELRNGVFTTLVLNYYNPDINSASNDYLMTTFGERIVKSKLFSLWLKAQSRYWFDRKAVADWEARIYCDYAR